MVTNTMISLLTGVYVYWYVYWYVCTCVMCYVYVCVYVYVCMYVYLCVRAHVCVCVQAPCVLIHACTYTSTESANADTQAHAYMHPYLKYV